MYIVNVIHASAIKAICYWIWSK